MRKMMANIAASGAVNTRSLRAAKSSSLNKPSQATAGAVQSSSKGPRASMAGYGGGRSTYIKSNDTGYGSVRDVRNKGVDMPEPPDISPYRYPGSEVRPTVDNLSPSKYNPFRADSQLAKMLK